MRTMNLAFGVSLLAGGAMAAEAPAPEPQSVQLTLKDHRFEPSHVTVIELINRDPASEEFDSVDLQVEKDVTPNGRVSFTLGPLKPGTYRFMGELHPATATGEIEVVGGP
jgi:cupredoxin-like protein